MNSDIFDCLHGESCKWEKKYRLKEKEYKKLEAKLEHQSTFYYEKLNSQGRQIYEWENLVQSKRKKNQKRKQKINRLKQVIKKKDEEIKELETQLEFSKNKILRLIKSRHQSVDQINSLEAEVATSRKQLQTPKQLKPKKERKSMQSTLEFNLQILPFEISEAAESKDQEILIETQTKLLQEERAKTRDLLHKLGIQSNEKNSMQSSINSLKALYSSLQTQAEEDKEKLKKVLTEKIKSLKIENLDLKLKLKEFYDGDSAANTSDVDFCNLKEELSKLEISNRSKLFELNNSANICEGDSRVYVQNSFQQLEQQKIIEMLEFTLNNAIAENKKLKLEIHSKTRYAKELNKILHENTVALKGFRDKFSIEGVREEVSRLNLEVIKINRMLDVKKMELNMLNEKIEGKLVGIKSSLEEVSEESLKKNMATLINKHRQFPEDYRRRRNIGSWSYNFFNQDHSIFKEEFP